MNGVPASRLPWKGSARGDAALMSRFTAARLVPCLVAWVWGCGAGEPLVVEVGTGVVSFEAVPPGAELRMVCGSQGGQHIWVAVRTTNAGGRVKKLGFAIRDAGDVTLCGLMLPSVDMRETAGVGSITGMICQIRDAGAVDGREVKLQATVEDAFGRSAADERAIVVLAPAAPCR